MAIKNNYKGGRRENHKYKALLVAQVLLKRTDDKHAIRTSEIVEYLEAYGINAYPEVIICSKTLSEQLLYLL